MPDERGKEPENAFGSDAPDAETAAEASEPAFHLPEVPPVPSLPDTPKISPILPPEPRHIERKAMQDSADYRRAGLAYTIPTALIAPIVLLTLIGWWLDGHFNKSPDFTLGGALLGVVVGFLNMFRLVNKLND
jgi:hypothetical protein